MEGKPTDFDPRGSALVPRRRGHEPAPYVDIPYSSYGYGADQGEPEHAGLLEYWRIIQRRKGALLLCAFLGLVAGVLITLPQTPIYQARTTLEVLDINTDFMNMKQAMPVVEASQMSAISDIQTQIKILQSESLLERVVDKLKIDDPQKLSTDSSRISAWRRALNLPEPKPVEERDAAIAHAAANLKVQSSGQTRIIEVRVDSTDAKLAADFANTLTNEFIEQNMEARWKATQRTGEWLQRQLEDTRIRLERSEDALQEYARRAGLMMVTEKESVTQEKLRQVQQSLSAAQADRVAKQSRWEMAKSSPADALPDVLNDATLRQYQGTITELKRQLADLRTTYTPQHSKVKKILAQLQPLEAELERERGNILKRIENEYYAALRHEKLLESDYRNQALLVNQDAEKSIQYNILKREVDTYRQLYDAMLQRVKESSIASAMRASNLRVVDPARAPLLPYKPDLKRSAAVGFGAGLLLGVMFVVFRERMDRTLQEPGDVAFYLGVPELGVIPASHAGARHSYYRLRRKHQPKVLTDADSKDSSQDGNKKAIEKVERITADHQSSMVAESFRATLTSILFSAQNGNRPRVLVLTSASPSEGKTTVASNLAIAIAEVNQRVLLVDGDLRKPRMAEIFAVASEPGLSDLLKDKQPVEPERLQKLIRSTSTPGLDLLPSGRQSAAAANLLHSTRLRELLIWAKANYDMVLIDTPPMLQMPDARIVGQSADAAILVLRANKTTRDAAIAAKQRLLEDGTPVLGTVFNDWDPKASGKGYYGYSKYSHYYRSHYYTSHGDKG